MTELQARIDSDLKSAMKQGQGLRVSVLRLLRSALSYKQIDIGGELSEAEVINVIDKEAKKRRESIAAYRGKRDDLADREQLELEILETYLPEGLSDAEIRAIIKDVIAESGEVANLGKLMGVVMGKLKSTGKRFDGSIVKKILEQK